MRSTIENATDESLSSAGGTPTGMRTPTQWSYGIRRIPMGERRLDREVGFRT